MINDIKAIQDFIDKSANGTPTQHDIDTAKAACQKLLMREKVLFEAACVMVTALTKEK